MRIQSVLQRAICGLIVLSVTAIGHAAAAPSFQIREIQVAPSPSSATQVLVPSGSKLVDFDVWPTGPEAVILLREGDAKYRLTRWNVGEEKLISLVDLPEGFEAHSVVCHPAARRAFVAGRSGNQSVILAFDESAGKWQSRVVYRTDKNLRRLLVGPRPFMIEYGDAYDKYALTYRLFFAVRRPDGTYSMRSILEDGKKEYQVIGPESEKVDEFPASFAAPASAMPASFHPAGHILIWQDSSGCFQQIGYEWKQWGKAQRVTGNPCGGSLTVTPNGANLLHWKKGVAGIEVISDHGRSRAQQATEYTFLGTPSSTPDGKGIVGLVQQGDGTALVYVPISVPLADVVNAWMFTQNAADAELFQKNAGLFRATGHEQIFTLYDTEKYACGGYDYTTPTRPFLVTTDIFWEQIAAAYEGTFIIQERQKAIPAFWSFVGAARNALKASSPESPWTAAFTAVAALHDGTGASDAEVTRIKGAKSAAFSPVFGRQFDFAELKPRGHYASEPALAAYFKAVHYLTQLGDVRDAGVLNSLPDEVKTKALQWIGAYSGYIAPARGPLVWSSEPFTPPEYARHPVDKKMVFPLSFGFDNEVLLSTVFHPKWPEKEWITGPKGDRILPSGLDLAAALGSGFARSLLKAEIQDYPNLGPVLDALAARSQSTREGGKNLYDDWLSALAVQWADGVNLPGVTQESVLWKTKRLQTGLASWATLRHATVLVNERTNAECGEGGFEAIVLSPPRGYVEPDPKTFAAIAHFFEQMAQFIAASSTLQGGTLPADEGDKDLPLREGILRRLKESADDARHFQAMAEKEVRGQNLSDEEYQDILDVGAVAEHNLLVFKSLANKDLALSNPDPMMKIADVAGGPPFPLLESAVGRPLEWDQIVPFFGRRELVKGSVYSYYEFAQEQPMNDAEWLKRVDAQERPDWVKSFISSEKLSCPAKQPF